MLIRTPTHDVGMRDRFGTPKRYVAPKTFNAKTLNVKRLRENYSPWKMLFRSHWSTTFGRGNGISRQTVSDPTKRLDRASSGLAV